MVPSLHGSDLVEDEGIIHAADNEVMHVEDDLGAFMDDDNTNFQDLPGLHNDGIAAAFNVDGIARAYQTRQNVQDVTHGINGNSDDEDANAREENEVEIIWDQADDEGLLDEEVEREHRQWEEDERLWYERDFAEAGMCLFSAIFLS